MAIRLEYDPRYGTYAEICEMCGRDPDDCTCAECPTCLEYGNPMCYLPPHAGGHGVPYTWLQYRSLQQHLHYIATEAEKENRFWDDEFMLTKFNHSRWDAYQPWQALTWANEENRECLLSIAIAMNDFDFGFNSFN
jgi:hypothetical protein